MRLLSRFIEGVNVFAPIPKGAAAEGQISSKRLGVRHLLAATPLFIKERVFILQLYFMSDEQELSSARELTFGEKAVGLTFNPSGDVDVQALKTLYAAVIDHLNNMRGADRSEKQRLISIAITEAQGAQMWAVKAVTWKD